MIVPKNTWTCPGIYFANIGMNKHFEKWITASVRETYFGLVKKDGTIFHNAIDGKIKTYWTSECVLWENAAWVMSSYLPDGLPLS